MKKINFFDLKKEILKKIKKNGGFVNAHCHLDRAFTLFKNNFKYTEMTLQEKWSLVDEIKRNSTVSQIYDRMAFAVEKMISQEVQAIGTFIDIDDVIKDKAIKASEKIKQKYGKIIKIKFINQVLKGVIEKKAHYWFDYGSEFVDIIGGLPGKDKGKEEEHLEIILEKAKKLNKMVHVHVDQLNTNKEKETELLIRKTKEANMNGKAVAVHSISLAAHKKDYRKKIYNIAKEINLMFISCPTAWIDSRRTENLTVTHNSVTPVDEMIDYNLTVAIGTDNIADIYKPFTDGDMWTELRFLLEANHFYKLDKLIEIASINGLKVLGINL
ncbi:MAG: amidohydrolase family protein [Patescibacteria group bacterium]|nr:amidohydrolase family protein [Patescibacteria group bacterium]